MRGTVTARDGAELYYEATGAGRPIVLLHGGVLDCRMWDAEFERLGRAHRVIRYDARGHGRSAAATGDFGHHEDLHVLLAALSVPRATLVGLSLGARTAIDFALVHPAMVDALVLAAPGASGMELRDPVILEHTGAMVAAFRAGDRAGVVEAFLRAWVDGPRRRPDEVDPRVCERLRVMATDTIVDHPPGPARELHAIDRLDELAAPILVLVGDLDASDIVHFADRLAAQAPQATKAVIAGAGHALCLERPDEFVAALDGFLARTTPRAP
jgi:3-oxoadipate enol-lactonase